jgi:hypothetical protein
MMDGRSPNGRSAYMIGVDDLEPDFYNEVMDVGAIARQVRDEVNKLTQQFNGFRESMNTYNKEDNGRFRTEVRQTLSEHFEYIKELHD